MLLDYVLDRHILLSDVQPAFAPVQSMLFTKRSLFVCSSVSRKVSLSTADTGKKDRSSKDKADAQRIMDIV